MSAAQRITLVTGGAGFIGSHIVAELAARGETVRVLDNLATGKRENLAGIAGSFEFIEGDLRDPDVVRRAVDGAAYVLHLGALGSVPRSIADPVATNQTNVDGTLNVLVAARDAGVKRVVYASSSSVYGDTAVLPKVETMPLAPRSPYAVSKLAGEAYCLAFHAAYGLETVALRYFNVFGPRQDPDSQYAAVIPRFLKAMMAGEPPVIFGDGSHSRDFTYVENAALGTLRARTAPGIAGGVFNIACDDRHTILELARKLDRLLGAGLPPVHADPRPGDVRHSRADISRARAWGYEVKVGFDEGLERTVAAALASENGA